MGYKLAGYDVIAANDIDPQMAKVYKENHHPKHFFQCGISELLIQELPEELYDLDILDGSPPCSTFSMAGVREKKWGSKHKFREGQSEQILDDLFFQFIKLVDKLKPRIVVAENVKGLLAGNAKGYVLEIKKQLEDIGYDVQIFMLNAATMGVPQKRERIFFICKRKELGLPLIDLEFSENLIPFRNISDNNDILDDLTPLYIKYWNEAEMSGPIGKFKSNKKLHPLKVANTVTSSGEGLHYYKYKRKVNLNELSLIGSFPGDYNYLDISPKYLIGMSVPPIMMAQIANQIYKQWLKI